MDTNIFKTDAGRQTVLAEYCRILRAFCPYPWEEISVETPMARTTVLRFGDPAKPPLLALHGSMANSATWIGCIGDFIDDFCFYAVDLPGEPGLSEPIRCTLATDEPLDWLAGLMDGLNLPRAAFLTMSLGSWYALNLAARHPERAAALSIFTTGGIAPAKKGFALKALWYLAQGAKGQEKLARAVYHKAEVPRDVLDFQALVTKNFNPTREALPIFSDEEIRRITAPVQYFGGDADALLDTAATARRLAALLPGAEINVLPDTGHAILDQFGEAARFLKGCL